MRAVFGARRRSLSGLLLLRRLLVAQRATQDLADVGLRQFGTELDVARLLVAGEFLRQCSSVAFSVTVGVLLHDEYLHRLAGILIG
jgi:hypothetical protein